jgi:hypothetical protein
MILTYAKPQRWYANCYLPFIRTLFVESDPTKVGETDTRQPPLCNKLHVSRWNRSHVRGHVKLVRAASSHNIAESRSNKWWQAIWISTPITPLCSTHANTSTHRPSSWYHCWGTLHENQKKSYESPKIYPWRCIATRGESIYIPL